MTLKKQLIKLKENWLIAVLVIFVVVMVFSLNSGLGTFSKSSSNYATDTGYGYNGYNRGGTNIEQIANSDFAPEVKDRKIITTTSMNSEIERGKFKEAEANLERIISSSDSYLLYSTSNNIGDKNKRYYVGSYTIKVETKKYDSVVSQLKNIGKVKYFSENSQDITGSYTNLKIELEAEKERLKRYNELYTNTVSSTEKISLIDKIYDQERRVYYLEESINGSDERVQYSTIQINLNEEQPNYYNVVLVKFSRLIEQFVKSFNGLLQFIFLIAPWAIITGLIWLIIRIVRRKN